MSAYSVFDCITSTPKIYVNIPQNPISTDSNNVIIGHNSYNAVSNGYVNCTVIGNDARCTANAQVQLGSSIANIYSFGGIQNISDLRDKTDIRDITLGLDFLCQLHPVDYKWNCRRDYIVPTGETEIANGIRVPVMQELPNDGSKTRNRYHHGLIAQEVKQVMDTFNVDFGGYQDHSIKGGQEQLSIAYTELIAPMIKAIQELKILTQPIQWQTYNPIWTASNIDPIIGNGTITGRYQKIGKTISISINITMGTTTTYGNGYWRISLPYNGFDNNAVILNTLLFDYNTNTLFQGISTTKYDNNTSYIVLFHNNENNGINLVNTTTPFIWTVYDSITITGTYETL